MEGLLWFLIIGGLFYLMMRFGCGAHMVHGHGSHEAHSFIDPVCGMSVDMNQGYGKMHDGRWYRFCSRSCLDKFDTEPERYLKPQNAGGGDEK